MTVLIKMKTASEDYAVAENDLGHSYEYGLGIKQDYLQAKEWYEKSAKQGNAYAQNNLGEPYEYGAGAEKDLQQATE